MLLFISLLFNSANCQWVLQNSYTPDNLVDIVVLDPATAIIIGDGNAILRTIDAGTTWTNVTIMLSALFHWNVISFSNKLDGVIVGDHAIWITTDGGASWKPRNAISGQKSLAVLQLHPPYLMVGSDSGFIHASHDTGTTWTAEKISNWGIRSIFPWRGIFNIFYGLPVFALTPYSLGYTRVYPQGKWDEDTLEAYSGLNSEAFDGEYCNGGGPGFIVGVQGDKRATMSILRNEGIELQWLPVPSFSAPDGELFGVSAPSSNVIYVCGSGGTIFKSTDGGDSWIKMSTPTERNLRAIYFYDELNGFAVGDSGTILYTSNGGMTGLNDISEEIPSQFSLYQNYPNPFNPSTVISYQLPVTCYITLKVHNMLGQEVMTLFNGIRPAGNYKATFDGREFASGVYLYQLKTRQTNGGQANNFEETKKLILLK